MKYWIKFVLLIMVSVGCLSAVAEVQKGVVKTCGRLNADGTVAKGRMLEGVIIKLTNGHSVVSDKNGEFAIALTSDRFGIDTVIKGGYQLVNPEVLSMTYNYQSKPLVIVMESLQQIEADKLACGRKIRRTLDRQFERKQQEIEELKEKNKLTEEPYIEALRKLNEEVGKSEKLVAEMAERYAKIDYDSIDDSQRQVAAYILEGELTKADSLINTKESLESCPVEINRIREAKVDFATSLNSIGLSYVAQGEYDKALEYFQRALAIQEKVLSSEHPDVAGSLSNIGMVYYNQVEYSKALEYLQRALKIAEKSLDPEHPNVATTLNNIGGVYGNQGEYAKALEYYQRALKIYEKSLGPENPSVAMSLNNIGAVYGNQGEYAKALEYYQRALEIREKALGPEHPDVATLLNNIGLVYDNQGEYTKALEYYQRALKINEKSLGPEHPDVAMSLNNIAIAYELMGNKGTAAEYRQRAEAISEKLKQ